jgi:hypothetical protein
VTGDPPGKVLSAITLAGCRRVANRTELDHAVINVMIDWRALATRQRSWVNPPTTRQIREASDPLTGPPTPASQGRRTPARSPRRRTPPDCR